MNKEEIIRLAREAGLWEIVEGYSSEYANGDPELFLEEVERFAALVAAHEREECAKVCDKQADADKWEGHYAHQCAAAIRSRT